MTSDKETDMIKLKYIHRDMTLLTQTDTQKGMASNTKTGRTCTKQIYNG